MHRFLQLPCVIAAFVRLQWTYLVDL